ncbi:MAG TPA: 1-acyl-sn-glycerol-3-phosphate acyltransferase, partial [Ferruginibacter sp.]|nr:1-acyl-sn-glycerol-3-phosphate acyltransferase [Ferruginibacter sp.]
KPLKPFYDGAFKLALASQKQIIPCVIKGTTDAMPIHKKFYLFPTRLSMQFLPPVSSTNVSVEELKEKVYNSMLEEYTRNP